MKRNTCIILLLYQIISHLYLLIEGNLDICYESSDIRASHLNNHYNIKGTGFQFYCPRFRKYFNKDVYKIRSSILKLNNAEANSIGSDSFSPPIYSLKILNLRESTALITLRFDKNEVEKCWSTFSGALKLTKGALINIHKYTSDKKFPPLDNVKLNVLGTLLNGALLDAHKNHELKIIGKPRLVKPIESLLLSLHPKASLKIDLEVDLLPNITFKKPYKGISLRVPKPPYPENLLWNLTLDELSSKHSTESDSESQIPAQWGDSVKIEITDISRDCNKPQSCEYPGLSKGCATIIMEQNWNPPGLCEGLLGINKNETRIILIEVPNLESNLAPENFSVEENKTLKNLFNMRHNITNHTNSTSNLKVDPQLGTPQLMKLRLMAKCLLIRNRIRPKFDDKFFLQLCNLTKDQVKSKIEHYATKEIEKKCHRARRGAIENYLHTNIDVDIPEFIIEQRCLEQWNEYLRRKRVADSEENDEIESLSLEDWKERSLQGVIKGLSLEFAIEHIKNKEKIKIDESEVLRTMIELQLKIPIANFEHLKPKIIKTKEAEAVYDWIADHGNIDYYVDHRPVQISVNNTMLNLPNSTVTAYQDGASPEIYEQEKLQMLNEAEKILHLSKNFTSNKKSW